MGEALSRAKWIRHLPVVEAGRVRGVIFSLGVMDKDIISKQAFMIEQLEGYITGLR